MGVPNPTFIPIPFAEDASSGFINFPIPEAPPASPPNAACWEQGFQSITMQPEISGGLPPFGQDFNGILNTITQAIYALQAGQLYQYDSSFASSISGYDQGAILAMTDGSGLWLNITAGNTANPDTGTAPGYVALYSYGAGIIPTTGGTTALTGAQSKKTIFRVQGALTSNAIILIPNQIGEWTISNETTGAHTLTAQMVALGASVLIPQTGVTAPTGVYSPDGTNLYATSITTAGLAPINNPVFTGTPQAPTPVTSSNTTQLATTAFVKAVFASGPAIGTGATGVTQALGDNSTKLATDQFVNPGGALTSSASWWRQNPDGSIEQGGSFVYNGSDSTHTYSFVKNYVSKVLNITFTSTVGGFTPGWDGNTLSTFTASFNGMGGTSQTCYWRAIGV